MAINLVEYEKALVDAFTNYRNQRDRLIAYNHSHFSFNDSTQVSWTQADKAKALAEAQADVTALVAIVENLKTALDMV